MFVSREVLHLITGKVTRLGLCEAGVIIEMCPV